MSASKMAPVESVLQERTPVVFVVTLLAVTLGSWTHGELKETWKTRENYLYRDQDYLIVGRSRGLILWNG